MRELKLLLIIFAVSMFTLSSCNDGNGEEKITKKYLVDYELITPAIKFDVGNAKAIISQFGFGNIADHMKYNIQMYKLTYKTLFEGDTIFVSGVVAAPIQIEKKETFPILSYQHGTIVKKSDAPSVNINNEYLMYLASTGMVIVMADYIGFGASSAEFHPYMHNEYTVNAVLDMIRASKEFIAIEKPCDINNKLFMLGYSQGASATLGALSAIENNNANSDLTVTLASCGAGAYNLTDMHQWIMKQARYEQPFYIGYLLESFSRYANVDIDYARVFNEVSAAQIPGMFDGKTGGDVINAQFGTSHVGELFNDDFEDDNVFSTDPVYASLVQAFEANKIEAWATSTSIRLYYGSEDLWVPGEQSLKIWQQFQTAGATANVKLVRVDGKNHTTAIQPTIEASLEWFLSE